MEDAAGGDEVKGEEGRAGEEEKGVLRKRQGQEEILEEEQSKETEGDAWGGAAGRRGRRRRGREVGEGVEARDAAGAVGRRGKE